MKYRICYVHTIYVWIDLTSQAFINNHYSINLLLSQNCLCSIENYPHQRNEEINMTTPNASEATNSKQKDKSDFINSQDTELDQDEPLVREDSCRVLWRTVNPYYYKQDLLEAQVNFYFL